MLTQEQIINEFANALKTNRNSSHNTISAYKTDLSQYLHYLKSNRLDYKNATYNAVDIYIKQLSSAHKKNTVLRKISTIKTFHNFLVDYNYTNLDPTIHLDAPKQDDIIYGYLSDEEMLSLLSTIANVTGYESQRNALIVQLLCATGIRIGELLSINIEDINHHNSTLTITGLNKRVVCLDEDLLTKISNYNQNIRSVLLRENHQEKALFVNHYGQRLTRQWVWSVLKDLAREAGVKSPINPNILRHTLAIQMLKQGHDMSEVQKLLGLRNANTTKIYSKMIKEGV